MRLSRLKPALLSCSILGALSLGGCVSDGGTNAASNSFARADAATVAFESVDGPPPQVFDRLVSALDSEAKLRGIPVVSREGASTYRVRSYLSAQIRGKRTTIAWTWDVYDRDQQRAMRLSGEEATTRGGPDASYNAWASADDTVIRRIAQAGLTGLNGLLTGQIAPTSVPASRGSGLAIAENAQNPQDAPVPVTAGFSSR